MPSTFISVSLAERVVEDEGAPPEKRAAAHENIRRTVDRFLAETGWRPTHVAEVAGALMYSKYNMVIKFVMKLIARHEGAPVDTTRDYEFTNWTKLGQVIDELLGDAPSASAAAQG
jgi:menaquinone-dependent protoporphyrinogen oxidase